MKCGSVGMSPAYSFSYTADDKGHPLQLVETSFLSDNVVINTSKMAILLASLTAGTIGFLWLKLLGKPVEGDKDLDVMDFEADVEVR